MGAPIGALLCKECVTTSLGEIGERASLKRLPRADACWYEPIKFEGWILAPRGHGREWQQVFGVGLADQERVWQALASAARTATIVEVRDRESLGVVCGMRERVAIGDGARWSP